MSASYNGWFLQLERLLRQTRKPLKRQPKDGAKNKWKLIPHLILTKMQGV